MPYDLNGSGGILAGAIDWGAAASGGSAAPSAASSTWQQGIGTVTGALTSLANAYANVRAAGRVNQNPDAIVTDSDRLPAQDERYTVSAPRQVGVQIGTGTLLVVLALAVGAVLLLKDKD